MLSQTHSKSHQVTSIGFELIHWALRKDTFLRLTTKHENSEKVKHRFSKIEYHLDCLNRTEGFVVRLTDFSDRKKRTNKFTKLDVFQTKQCVQQCLMKILV